MKYRILVTLICLSALFKTGHYKFSLLCTYFYKNQCVVMCFLMMKFISFNPINLVLCK